MLNRERYAIAALIGLVMGMGIHGCGGGSGGSNPPPPANNPVPAMTAVSPTSAVLGGGSFTLTVQGSNFVSGTTVQWNGSSRPTAFAGSAQVSAQIQGSDIPAAGKVTITVSNPAPGGGVSNSLTFNVLPLPRFAYVVNYGSGTIAMMTVNYTPGQPHGQLWHNGYITAKNVPSATIHPSSQFAFMPEGSLNKVSVYAIDLTTGNLTFASSVASGTGGGTNCVAVDPSGKFAYATNGGSNNVSMYTINTLTGALTPIGTGYVATGTFPASVAVDPSGKYVYVANYSSNDVSMYSINATTGTLTAIGTPGTVAAGSEPISVAADPSGRFIYVVNLASNNISIYRIGADGTLSSVGSGTVTAGSSPESVTVDPSGRFVYVANQGSDNVSMYRLSSDGALAPIGSGTVAAGTSPQSVAVDPSGQFVYVANYGSGDVSLYGIDSSSGALTSMATIRVGSGPGSIVLAGGNAPVKHGPNYAYAVSPGSVTGWTVDPANGKLVEGPGSIAAGAESIAAAADPSGRFLYVANEYANTVSMYTIDPGGHLTSLGTVATGLLPRSVAVDPSGRFTYVANSGSCGGLYPGCISWYTIDALGTLSYGGSVYAGTTPTSVAVDPTGQFVYVVDYNDNTVWVYRVDATTGSLTNIEVDWIGEADPGGSGRNPVAAAVDPTGRFLYVADPCDCSAQVVAIYTIRMNGTLTLSPSEPYIATPSLSVALDPTGRFVYVASSSVFIYAIDATTGVLTKTGTVSLPSSSYPSWLAVHPSGLYLYVTSRGTDDVTMFAIDQSTGNLTSLGTASKVTRSPTTKLASFVGLVSVTVGGTVCATLSVHQSP